MTTKERAVAAIRYLLTRLSEPSTIKGLILAASAFGWWRIDNTSQGEGIAQMGLLIVGLINATLSQSALYGRKDDVR